MNIIHQRLHNQWLDHKHDAAVADLVRWMGAVQAQEYIPSLWGLGIRLSAGTTKQTIVNALEEASIVRTWVMRGTIHYAPASDAAWMVRLLGHRINKKYRTYHEKVGLHENDFTRGKQVLLNILAGKKACTRKELYTAFAQAGIAEPSKQGRGSFILQYWAQEGLICFGPYREKQQTFVLFNDWVSTNVDLSDEEALAELTQRYFASHGPATAQDFAWWSGLTAAEVRQGIAMVSDRLTEISHDGIRYFQLTSSVSEEIHVKPAALLLPCFDEYSVGYKNRAAILDPQYMQQLGYGVNYNLILMDGRIIGTWKYGNNKSGSSVILSPLHKLNQADNEKITRAVKQYEHFMSL